jgi:outer membrane protein assembly factor BamB
MNATTAGKRRPRRCCARWATWGVFLVWASCVAGCADAARQIQRENHTAQLDWIGTKHPERASAPGPLRLRWVRDLGDPTTSYIPWQYAAVAADPAHDRVYIGARKHSFWLLNGAGGLIAEPLVRGSVQSPAVVDPGPREVYFGTDDGMMYAAHADTGVIRWKSAIGNSVRQPPLLLADAVVGVAETDVVLALHRRDGSIKWRYQREVPGGMTIEGHAGLLHHNGLVITGFTDGVVLALDGRNGQVKWEIDTSQDVEEPPQGIPRFIDVDTTPTLVQDGVYVASVAGGMYYIGADDGAVRWRNSLITGVTSIAAHRNHGNTYLLVSSADQGLLCLREHDRAVMWRRSFKRGAPTQAAAIGDVVLVGETDGAFLALRLTDGTEVGRVESGTGFSARPVIAAGRAFVVSNGGTLFAFDVQKPATASPRASGNGRAYGRSGAESPIHPQPVL